MLRTKFSNSNHHQSRANYVIGDRSVHYDTYQLEILKSGSHVQLTSCRSLGIRASFRGAVYNNPLKVRKCCPYNWHPCCVTFDVDTISAFRPISAHANLNVGTPSVADAPVVGYALRSPHRANQGPQILARSSDKILVWPS